MFKKLLVTCIALIAGANATFAANSLSDTAWNLVSYNWQEASGTLSFSTDRMYSKFCNNVSQWYTYNNNTITSDGMAMSTMMYCEGWAMTLENNFDIGTGGTSSVVNWDQLTITTDEKNIFTFKKENTDQTVCTMQYAPVCGEVEVQCIKAPCLPVKQTFGNSCMANAAEAKNITQGECTTDQPMPGSDRDEYGCIPSAGYSRDSSLQQCVRPWELTNKIISRAFDAGITKYNTEKTFMGNSYLTREQAAKMLMSTIKHMNVPVWMIKQSAGSCEWKDQKSINTSLMDSAKLACTKWLLKWSKEGNFMPQKAITVEEMSIILERIATFVPSLKNTISILLINQSNPVFTRNEFVKILYNMSHKFTEQSEKYTQQKKDLKAARALWNQKWKTTYNFIQQMSCFCMTDYTRPITYKVVDGVVQTGSLTYSDDNTTVSSDITMNFYTVEGAFDLIDSAIEEHVTSLMVSYDELTGYPKSVSIDYNEMIADEEKYYTFTVK